MPRKPYRKNKFKFSRLFGDKAVSITMEEQGSKFTFAPNDWNSFLRMAMGKIRKK